MAKRNMIERALRGARGVVRDYVRPGARSAEETIDDLLATLGDLRKQLAAQRRRFGAKRKSSKRAATARRGTKRRVKRMAKKVRGGAARRKKRS